MSKIEVKQKNHPLNGLYLYDKSYSLNGEIFNNKLKQDIIEKTKLEMSDETWDWWTFSLEDNPILNWKELVMLSLKILNCKSTNMFVNGLYIKSIPNFKFQEFSGELPIKHISGAKRVNAYSGDYTDHSESVGLKGLFNLFKDTNIEPKEIKMSGNKFRLSGKDESCCVEGSWLDWCMFACNVLASKNTEIICPELFALDLKNDNY